MSRAWPPLVALAVVSVLAIAMLGVDLAVERRAAGHTAELVDDALKSVSLADDLGAQARRLSAAHTPLQIGRVAARIEEDIRAYDPLATYPGERAEWTHLQGLLDHLKNDASMVDDIEASIARLVEINQREAADGVAEIRHEHRVAIAIGAIGVVAILALIGVVAVFLVRAMRRERAHQEEVEAFARRVAHDLRGPLQPLRGYAEMTGGEVGAKLVRSVDRMNAIIRDLLELSLSGKPPPGETAVATVVDDVLVELQPALVGARVSVSIDACRVACSPGVLSQLLANLVSNACKYRSPARPLEIEIRGAVARGEIVLAVNDNGVGMAAEDAAHAFDPLYRAPATAQIEGTGLGLAIVKRTLEAIGGDCRLASEHGVGTRVELHLPAA